MPKVWLVISSGAWRQRGFLTIEVLLAAVVFGFVTVAVVGAFVYGRQATAGAGDYDRASALAEEGVEAIRNIRDNNFTNLPGAGTYYLSQSGSIWSLVSSPAEPTINGLYTRQVTVANVDGDRKTVTVTVSWTINGKTRQANATSRLTDWQAAIVPPITPGPIIMAYSKTTTTPFYRIWNGSAWGTEASASAVTGNVNFVVLKSARTRNEAILGVQTTTGAIYVQVWNGTSWGAATQVGTGPTTTRSFDIAYEKNGDRAMIVYTPSSGAIDYAYRTWNGTTLSAAVPVNGSPTTGAINWIELRQNPLSASNEIAMMLLDATTAVYGMRWNGSSWAAMGLAATWDGATASSTKKTIDVEYEQTSGEIMFIWGDSVATDAYYRTWNGTTLTGPSLLDIPAMGGAGEWVQLAARPNSNEIMFGVQDAHTSPDLNTRKWSGTAWDTATEHPEHSAGTENLTSRNFDIVWETHASNPGKAWLMWGDGATVSKKQWSGTAWGSASTLTGSDDTSFVRLRADPVSGAIFAGLYESTTSATDDIWESRLTGGGTTWTAKNSIWAGPTTAEPTNFKIDIATP